MCHLQSLASGRIKFFFAGVKLLGTREMWPHTWPTAAAPVKLWPVVFVRLRSGKVSTTSLACGSLLLALGLTALSDTQAMARGGDIPAPTRLKKAASHTEMRILDWSLWYVAKYYVEPDRIDPHRMTLAALEGLEKAIPEVLVEPIGSGGDEQATRVRVRVGTHEREFQIGKVEALWGVGTRVREVVKFVHTHTTLTEEQRAKAEYTLVEGVLGTLDPHTTLLRPEAFESMRTGVRGNFGGLGIEIGSRDSMLTVIRVIDGNPADKVGIKAGDKIVQIEGESTVTMSLSEAVERLRGEAGTTVSVYIRREGLSKPKRFKVTREIIKLESVIGTVLPGTDENGKSAKVGHIQLNRNFAQTTGKELIMALQEFEKEGVRGVVLDMRNNPGGLLQAAVEVADAFLDAGTIVSTVGPSAPRDVSRATDRYQFPDLPVVVLIDEGSASATEIVAGALRNRDRAILMGRRTFGKGSVQVLHDRKVDEKELALKLTIAQYLTPGDISIQSVGVSPDLETIPVAIGEETISYYARKRFDFVREEALTDHLTNDKVDPAQKITAGPLYFRSWGSIGGTRDERKKQEKADKAKKSSGKKTTEENPSGKFTARDLLEDPEIQMARDFVLWAPTAKREQLIEQLPEFVSEQQQKEQRNIAESLQKRGIDWSAGPAPAPGQAPQLAVTIRSDKPNNTIKGGESGVVTVSVKNTGASPAYQVRAMSDSDYIYFDERELFFGRIDPGQTKTFDLKLNVAEHEHSRTDQLDFLFYERHGAKVTGDSQSSIQISSEGLPRPQFAYGFQVLDDPAFGDNIRGNGDGLMQVGERVKLHVHVKNTGEGDAVSPWAILRNLSGEGVFLHTGRVKLKKLPKGQHQVAEFDLELKKAADLDVTKLQLSVSDTKIGTSLTETLRFPRGKQPVTFAKQGGGVLTQAAADLYAAPQDGAQVVARSKAGTKFKLLGQTETWYRVQVDNSQHAFLRKSAGQVVKSAGGKAKVDPVFDVSPPQISLVSPSTSTQGESIQIKGTASDGEAVRDVYITVTNPSRNLFGGAEKVYYQANPNPQNGSLAFTADIPLTPGNNRIEIIARENEEVTARKQMWVLRTSGLAEARANKTYKSDGKLSVDTFNN